MTCEHEAIPTLVEQMVMREPDGPLRHWRMYRIEYGHECSCPEGVIWLPPSVSAGAVETLMRGWTLRVPAVGTPQPNGGTT